MQPVATALPAVIIALAVAGCGTATRPVTPAPATTALDLAPDTHVVVSLPGPSDVDSSQPRRYRYMFIRGPRHSSATSFLLAETRALRRHGWAHEQAWMLKGPPTNPRPRFVSLATHGATVQLDRVTNGHEIYTEVKVVGRHANVGQITDGDPRYPYRDRVAAALRTGEPVLDVLLGNGPEPDLE